MDKYIISKEFNELTEIEKMILSIKGAIREMEKYPELKNFYGAFITTTINSLQEKGIDKEEIFKYKYICK